MRGRFNAPGQNLAGMFRYGSRVYTSRPPANCYSARRAWDRLSARGKPPIRDMHLMDGYWTCERTDGSIDDCENVFWLDKRRREAAQDDRRSSTSDDEAEFEPRHLPSTRYDE